MLHFQSTITAVNSKTWTIIKQQNGEKEIKKQKNFEKLYYHFVFGTRPYMFRRKVCPHLTAPVQLVRSGTDLIFNQLFIQAPRKPRTELNKDKVR